MATLAPPSRTEQLTARHSDRWVLVPGRHPRAWEFYKKAVASFWVVEEVDLSQDHRDLARLAPEERDFVFQVLAFFAASDGIVNENISVNFADEITVPEVRAFYTQQQAIETIHAEMYGLLVTTYVPDRLDQARLLGAVQTVDSIQQKAAWALRWFARERPLASRLLAFACVEGIFFSGSFCAIFWLKKRGLMPGLAFSNELISRDEGLHTDFACMLVADLVAAGELDQAAAAEVVRDAVRCEQAFVRDALRVDLIGMNAGLMCQYIEFIADRLLASCGLAPVFGAANPFDWMVMISLQGKTNFFEKRVGEYSKAAVGSAVEDRQFDTDADF